MKCKLLPFKRKDVLSAQDLEQKIGWGVQSLRVPDAWKYSEGEGVKVAVIDSGIDLTHQDLVENIYEGANFINKKEKPIDLCSHGTHVAGIIAASNNNLGIVGVSPKSKIVPVKVLDEDGSGEMKNVAKGIAYATELGVDFIVMSLGCPQPVQQVKKAIQKAVNNGIVIFCAAGNMGKSEHLLYPANYPEVISIGAVDKNMKRADFNNTGNNLDFLAPGVDILSTVPENWYAIMSGSSQAAPFVAGLASLLKSYKTRNTFPIKLTSPDDYRSIFKNYTMNVVGQDYAGDKFYQGFGIITPEKMIESIEKNPSILTA